MRYAIILLPTTKLVQLRPIRRSEQPNLRRHPILQESDLQNNIHLDHKAPTDQPSISSQLFKTGSAALSNQNLLGQKPKELRMEINFINIPKSLGQQTTKKIVSINWLSPLA